MKSNKTIIGLLTGLIIAVLIGVVVRNGFSPTFQIPVLHQTEQMVFAHRGGRSLGPENTLHTFQKALAYGAHVLELDVRLTRDGHLVVIHDATVDRTTDGTGAAGSLSLDDIGHKVGGITYGTTFQPEMMFQDVVMVLDWHEQIDLTHLKQSKYVVKS
jgi:glycerophosphoryl diester phosphodiesterase